VQDSDEESAVEPLIDALAECGEADIKEFENVLAQVLYDIDGRAYADENGDAGQSDDGFLYARCYVVGTVAQWESASAICCREVVTYGIPIDRSSWVPGHSGTLAR
jgi:hypothetical protein